MVLQIRLFWERLVAGGVGSRVVPRLSPPPDGFTRPYRVDVLSCSCLDVLTSVRKKLKEDVGGSLTTYFLICFGVSYSGLYPCPRPVG